MPPEERFDEKWTLSTEHEYEGTPCWEWTACGTKQGYGQFSYRGKCVFAHRWSYEHYRGAIPDNLCVLHHCDSPGCVCPSHLFLGTRTDNNYDRDEKGRHWNARKTHCPQGHPYDHIDSRGHRHCRTCRREKQQQRRAA